MTTKKSSNTKTQRRTAKSRAAEAKAKGAQIQTIKALVPIANEINTRLEKAEKLAGQAFDHRLAACLKLGEAKKRCAKDKVNFKQWCTDNVDKSYETVRKLASIGVHPEKKARLLLADLRDRTKSQVAKSRAKGASAAPKSAGQVRDNAPSAYKSAADQFVETLAGFNRLKPEERANVIKEQARSLDLEVVTKERAEVIGRNGHTVATLRLEIGKLSVADQKALCKWLAERLGGKATLPAKVPEIDPLEIPAALDRRVKKPAARKPAKGKKR